MHLINYYLHRHDKELSKFGVRLKSMQVNIIIFGRLTDITGASIVLNDVSDTNALVKKLHNLYPALTTSKYAIAVNKKIVNENTVLTENSIIALLPPFSGG